MPARLPALRLKPIPKLRVEASAGAVDSPAWVTVGAVEDVFEREEDACAVVYLDVSAKVKESVAWQLCEKRGCREAGTQNPRQNLRDVFAGRAENVAVDVSVARAGRVDGQAVIAGAAAEKVFDLRARADRAGEREDRSQWPLAQRLPDR